MVDIWYQFASSISTAFHVISRMISSFLKSFRCEQMFFLFFFAREKSTPSSSHWCDLFSHIKKRTTWIKMSKNDLLPIIYILCTTFFFSLLKMKENKVMPFAIAVSFLLCDPFRHANGWWNRCQKIEFQQYRHKSIQYFYKKWHQYCWMIYRSRVFVALCAVVCLMCKKAIKNALYPAYIFYW